MSKNDDLQVWHYAALIIVVSLGASILTLPSGYSNTSDIFISPVGMLISEGYRTTPFSVSYGLPGFYTQGVFYIYNNWPPLNFLVLAQWQDWFGTDVLTSRWLYILIKLATDLVCFAALQKVTQKSRVAMLATIIFSLFPFRLLFGSLIFCDSWILLFGWILTYLIISAEQSQQVYRNKTIFLIGLIAGIGTLFSWQVFFYLPAVLGFYYFKNRLAGFSWVLWGLLPAIILLTCWMLWVIFHPVSLATADNLVWTRPNTVFESKRSFFHEFLNRSWWRLIDDTQVFLNFMMKRMGKTLLEYSPIIFWVWFTKKSTKKEHSALYGLIRIHSLSVLTYLLVTPFMFAEHDHQIPLFSIVATLFLTSKLVKLKSPLFPALLIVAFQLLIFYFIIPRIHHSDKNNRLSDNKIVSIINPDYHQPKPILIIQAMHDNTTGLSSITHTHIYSGRNLKKINLGSNSLDSSIRAQMARFPISLQQQIDTKNVWLLSSDQMIIRQPYVGFNSRLYPLNDSLFLIHLLRK